LDRAHRAPVIRCRSLRLVTTRSPGRSPPALTRLLAAAAACGIAALAPPPAAARDRVAGLDYVVPPDCPPWTQLAATVARRTAGRWRVRLGPGEPHLSVEISDDPAGKIGFLRRSSGGASTTARELTAATCDDLVQALALTAALSLGEDDHQAAGAGEPGEPQVAREVARPPSPASSDRVLVVGIGTSFAVMFSPTPMSGAGLFIQSRRRRTGPPVPTLRAPDVTFTVAHLRNDLFGQDADARFALTTAALAVCPLAWY